MTPIRTWHTDLRASIAILTFAAICLTGCTTETTKQIVTKIAAQVPLVQAVVAATAATAEGIDPSASLLIASAANTAQLGLAQIQALCDAYTQSPSPTILASIGDSLNTLLNTNATALLDAAHILDPTSRSIAQASIGALQTALLLVAAILQRSQSSSQIAATAASRTYKLRDIAPYLNHEQIQQTTGIPFAIALHQAEAQGF